MVKLEIVKKIPDGISLDEVVRCLTEFHKDCRMDSKYGVDLKGFLNHTLNRFSMATFLNHGEYDLWLATDEGKIKSFVLCSVDRASNDGLCYFIHQAWVSRDYRNSDFGKRSWQEIKKRALQMLCGQIIIYSVRRMRAYSRLLGENLRPYSELFHLKLEA